MKVREIVRTMKRDGWYVDRQQGSHRQFKHPDKPRIVTVAGHPGKDVPIGTLKSILKSAGLEQEDAQ